MLYDCLAVSVVSSIVELVEVSKEQMTHETESKLNWQCVNIAKFTGHLLNSGEYHNILVSSTAHRD